MGVDLVTVLYVAAILWVLVVGCLSLIRKFRDFKCFACNERCNPFLAGRALLESPPARSTSDVPLEMPVCLRCVRNSPGARVCREGYTYRVEGKPKK